MALNWRQRQKLELRQMLYQTSLELFEANGYESTTVQQITDQQGVAKGTFFNHFPTKEHVIEEWYNNITSRSLEAARKRKDTSAEEAIVALICDMARQAMASPELLIAKSRNSANPLLIDAEQQQDQKVHEYLIQYCTQGKAQGELAGDLNEEFFVDLIIAVLTGSSRVWVDTVPRFDFPTVIRERVRFLFRAARPAHN